MIDPAWIFVGIAAVVVLIAVFIIIVVVVVIEALFNWCMEAIVVVKLPLESFGQLCPVGLKGGPGFRMNPWRSSEWHSEKVHRSVLCLPVGSLTDLSLDFIAEQGMEDGRGRGSGEGGIRAKFGDLDEISRFAPVHAICQRPREIMTKWAHPQHLVTEDAPLDVSRAGARDSITAVGM